MQIVSVGRALPQNYYEQAELQGALAKLWQGRFHNSRRLEQIHRTTLRFLGKRRVSRQRKGRDQRGGAKHRRRKTSDENEHDDGCAGVGAAERPDGHSARPTIRT